VIKPSLSQGEEHQFKSDTGYKIMEVMMGLCMGGFSRSKYDDSRELLRLKKEMHRIQTQMPNPHIFSIYSHWQFGKYLVVKVRYDNCTNYEGTKILLFEGVTMDQLRKWKHIDPHFSDSTKFKSPIARFVPTPYGIEMAVSLAKALDIKNGL